MVTVGIEAMNFFGGSAFVNVADLARHRNLDQTRFANLLMKEKTVVLPFEDPITMAVNAAKPLIDALSEAEKDRIELVITCTESGIDFGKSISTYVHHYLGLKRNCRMFEVKQACYSGTAGFQNAINFILSQASPGAKALVLASDIVRFQNADGGDALTQDWSFAEPSNGAGSVAMLVSENPVVFQVDVGANGYYGYEVCDTCRPIPDSEAGDADLSLLSYLDCCEQAYSEYQKRVEGADYKTSFQYLAFHTPFGGMIKGAHRNMMRKLYKTAPADIELDFQQRVVPGLTYCQRVGNVMGGTSLLSLLSTIANGDFSSPKRIGIFSYGSGCCSEFYSGVATAASQQYLTDQKIKQKLDSRYLLSMDEYDAIFEGNGSIKFGTRNVKANHGIVPGFIPEMTKQKRLILDCIKEYHREYVWTV